MGGGLIEEGDITRLKNAAGEIVVWMADAEDDRSIYLRGQ